MKIGVFLWLLLMVSVCAAANPTIIPLPELTGVYRNGVEKTTSFDSGLEFADIDSVQLHLSGSYTRGLLLEVGTGQYHTYDVHLESSSPLNPALWSTGSIQALNEGSFEWLESYSPLTQGASWDFMLNGHVEVRLKMPVYAVLGIYSQIVHVSYSIQEAHLEVWTDCNAITVQQPNMRQYLLAGSDYRIEWLDCRDVPSNSYLVSCSTNNGIDWTPVSEDPVTNTFYNWQVPDVSAENCLIKIEDATSSLSDISDAAFAIYQCSDPPAFDLNGDCYLDLLDYALLAAQWQESGGYILSDLVGLVENWLNCRNTFDPACSL